MNIKKLLWSHGEQLRQIQPWPYLNDALAKFQADKLLKIQRGLDETEIILLMLCIIGIMHLQHKTIDSVLAWGKRLDSLVEKSSDLSAASQRKHHTTTLGRPTDVLQAG
ncbi:VAMP-like protein YKT61 [Typha angustifolia]|uniref:VAMP-like protein YKT61 n=1 Tax=Typha angustifolia TaxID=59011 RepID=UPI003C2E56B0